MTGHIFVKNDLGRFHLPLRAFYADNLLNGGDFTWLPQIWTGFYVHGEGQAGMYHPLHLLLYRTLPLDTAFALEVLLPYPFVLAGTFLLLRRWAFPRDAALFGSLCFTFSGFNLLHHVHPNAISIVAHVPWLLVAIDTVMREPSGRRAALARLSVALLTASQLLLGYPQYVVLSLLIEGLYVLFVVVAHGAVGPSLAIVWGKILGCLLGCIQLIPTWDALSGSLRADPGLAYRYSWSLHPANVAQLVAPYGFSTRVVGGNTHEFGLYAGAATLALSLWLLTRYRDLQGMTRRLAAAAFLLAATALLLAMGEYGYLYRVQAHLPFVGLFRVPARYIVFVHFAMAITAAIALAELARRSDRTERVAWRRLWPLGLLPLASIGVAGFVVWARAHPESGSWIVSSVAEHAAPPESVLLGPVLLTAGTALVVASARGGRVALACLVVFAAADQAVYGLSYIWAHPGPARMQAFVQTHAIPPEMTAHRVQVPEDAANTMTLGGARLANGYVALAPRLLLDPWSPGRLKVAGVGWRQTAEGGWTRLDDPLPRARLVTRAITSADPGQDIDRVDVATTALVNDALVLPDGTPGLAEIARDRPGAVTVRTTAPSTQLLVLSESYHDGWQATVDGDSRPVVRVYGDFMGCVVEAGTHVVEFEFEPRSLRVGAWLSLLGLGLTLVSFLTDLQAPSRGGARLWRLAAGRTPAEGAAGQARVSSR